MDGGWAWAGKEFRLLLGHRKSLAETVEQSLVECESEPRGNLGEEHLSLGNRMCEDPTVVGGWLWKQKKEARVAETGRQRRRIVGETVDGIGE